MRKDEAERLDFYVINLADDTSEQLTVVYWRLPSGEYEIKEPLLGLPHVRLIPTEPPMPKGLIPQHGSTDRLEIFFPGKSNEIPEALCLIHQDEEISYLMVPAFSGKITLGSLRRDTAGGKFKLGYYTRLLPPQEKTPVVFTPHVFSPLRAMPFTYWRRGAQAPKRIHMMRPENTDTKRGDP